MKKVFEKLLIWNSELLNYKGLPRPYFYTDSRFYKVNHSFYLHKKIPIPWQSKPLMTSRPIDLIIENETRVYPESLCAYCGVVFDQEEVCVRWKANNSLITEIGPRVSSDIHPFHEECMKQARIFCPHMRKAEDLDFEYGIYKVLKNNAILQLEKDKRGSDMDQEVVKIINNFLSNEDCETIISYMDNQKDPKFWISNNIRQMIVNAEEPALKNIILKYLDKIKKQYEREDLYITEYMLSRYNSGFFMPAHIDIEDGKEHFTISGVAYLNNDFTGGDIFFPKLNIRHSPKMGDIALFPSSADASVHGVEIVTSGTRYAMPIWITDNPKMALPFFHS
jgi:hypothetical protein